MAKKKNSTREKYIKQIHFSVDRFVNIKGIHKTSLIDYPGKVSTVIFTGGCNLRCGYCHNPDLACDNFNLEKYSEDYVLNLLQKRIGLIDGVTISGGEPTMQKSLESFLEKINHLELQVKLDTNGLYPQKIKNLIKKDLISYIALDIKTSPPKYDSLTGKNVKFSDIIQTLEIIKSSGMDYEIRTTCIPKFTTLQDFKMIKDHTGHIKNYYLQQLVSDVQMIDPEIQNIKPYSIRELQMLKQYVETFSDHCSIRGI